MRAVMRCEAGHRALARLARLSLSSNVSARGVSVSTAHAFPALCTGGRGLARAYTAIVPQSSFAFLKRKTNTSSGVFTRGLAASASRGSSEAGSFGSDSNNTSGDAQKTANAVSSPPHRSPASSQTGTQASFAGTLTDASKTKVQAIRREAKGSPKKFNDVCRLVRGLRVEDAVAQCALSPKKYADVVRKVILSAAANATNNHDLDREKLMIVEALVGKGTFIKRISVHGRGRSGVITKPRSHVTIGVAEIGSDLGVKNVPPTQPLRRMTVVEHEAPWKRRRRSAMAKFAMAKQAGMV